MHLCISRFSKWLKRVNTFLRHPRNWHHSAAVLWTLCSIVQLRSLATREPHAQSKACLILFKLSPLLSLSRVIVCPLVSLPHSWDKLHLSHVDVWSWLSYTHCATWIDWLYHLFYQYWQRCYQEEKLIY